MNSSFSLLLIEPTLTAAAMVAESVGLHLDDCRLNIVSHLEDALSEVEAADIILLNARQAVANNLDGLTALKHLHPAAKIILLQPASDPVPDDALAAALSLADDYVAVSPVGMLALGRRLAEYRAIAGEIPPPETTAPVLSYLLSADSSPLGVQIVGSENRILAWNRVLENKTGLHRADVLGRRLDDLPLAPATRSALQNALRKARRQETPFVVSSLPLVDPQGYTRREKLFVYPVPTANQTEPAVVYMVYVDVTDLADENENLQQWYRQTRVLLEISQTIAENLDLNTALTSVAEQIKFLLNADNCHIYIQEVDATSLQPALSLGPHALNVARMPLAVGKAILSAAAENRVVMLNHTEADLHILCTPLKTPKGNLGLAVVTRAGHHAPFAPREAELLETLSRLTAAAISNATLFAETQRTLKELSIFYEASAAIASSQHPRQMLTTLIRQMSRGLEVQQGFIAGWNQSDQLGHVEVLLLDDDASPDIYQGLENRIFTPKDRPALQKLFTEETPIYFHLDDEWIGPAERQDMARFHCYTRLLAPMRSKNEIIGWVELWDTRQKRLFSPNELRLIRILANQAAVALENARYLQRLHHTLEETTALNEVARALASAQDTQSIISTVLREYLQVLRLRQGYVILFDFNRKKGIINTLLEDPTTANTAAPRGEGFQIDLRNNPIFTRLMQTRRPIVIDNVRDPAWKAPAPLPPGADPTGGWAGPNTRALLIVPIQILSDIQGAIVVEQTQPHRTFERSAITLGQAMADQLSIALQKTHLYEMEHLRRQQAETLREVSFIVGSSLHLNEVLEHILDQLGRVIKYDSAAIHLVEGRYRRIIAGRGFPIPEQVIGMTFPNKLDESEPGSIAIHTRQPLVIGDVQTLYPQFADDPHRHIHSWMGIPLIARDKVIGLISIDRREPNAYDENDVNLALAFANQVAIALENARLYELEVRQWERELEIARNIQQSMLPQIVPQIPGLEVTGRILPARQIGGDFFHFFPLKENRFGLAIGDVSGKGIPAALFMSVAMTAIDAQIGDSPGPGQLLHRLQRTLFNRLRENKMNIGIQVAVFDPPSAGARRMTLASAGMISPVLVSQNTCRYLPVSGLPLGSPLPGLAFNESTISLAPGSIIIFASDGIVEARNETGELFGFNRLEATIRDISPSRNVETIAEHIISSAQTFTGKAEQSDDMTVVVARVLPTPPAG